MPRTGSYTYDPQTGEWSGNSDSGGDSGGSSSSGKSGGADNLTANTPDKDVSSGNVEKKYNYIEFNTLVGSLSFIVTEETIQLKAGDTVTLNNIGKYLSGNYYVKEVTRQISSSGYSHTATLIRTDFGNSLKLTTTGKEKVNVQPEPSPPQEPQRTYTVKKGDCLWNIAKKFYGDGSSYGKIYDANTGQIADPHWIYPGQTFVIP